jgi:hypothetical protein
MVGKVTVKEEFIPGTSLKPGMYKVIDDLSFTVEGDVPSVLRKAARKKFQEVHGHNKQLLSCVMTARDSVQILFKRGRPQPVVEPGWMHKAPQPPKKP